MKIIEKNVNAITGEETFTEREETSTERSDRELSEKNVAITKAENEAKAIARADILKRLGITAEEASLLLG